MSEMTVGLTAELLGASWVDWAQVVGVFIAIIALGFTWAQARAAKNGAVTAQTEAAAARIAAQAASDAIDRAQRALRANQRLVLIPQLRFIASEMDNAVVSNDRNLARRHLENWRWQAGHIKGLLIEEGVGNSKKLMRSIQDSIALATTASGALLTDDGGTVLDACSRARESIHFACNEMTSFVGQAASQLPRDEVDEEK